MAEAHVPSRIVVALESSGPGGAENMVVQLAAALRRLDHHPIVATMREGWMTERAEAAGLPVWILPQKPGLDPGWIGRLAARLRAERVDVFHAHEFAMNVFGGAAAFIARVPALSTIHGKHWIADRGRRILAYRVLRALGIPIVAVSEDLAHFLAERFRLRRDQLELVHNGIPIPSEVVVDRSAARAEIGIPPDGALIVAIGNLYPVKDHATLVRAAATLPGVRVAIAGRGDEEGPLRQLASELGVGSRVHLLGLRDDVPRILAAADVFAQPSRSEGLPLAVLEAMAAGRPVVATRVGGMGEAVVHGETGLLVEPGQPAVLAEAIRSLLGDPERLARMGAAGRTRAELEFSIESMARRYASLYARLLESRTDRRAQR